MRGRGKVITKGTVSGQGKKGKREIRIFGGGVEGEGALGLGIVVQQYACAGGKISPPVSHGATKTQSKTRQDQISCFPLWLSGFV
jgi:hypothetical protein